MSCYRFFLCVPLFLAIALFGAPALSADPSTKPFPRIEAGQHTAPIKRIGVDTAGRRLVTASDDKTARIWNLTNGALERVLRPPIGDGNEGKLYAAALSPDGKTVAVGGWTGYAWDRQVSIYLFDRASGELKHRIGGLPNVIYHLAFSPDGARLAAALGAGEGIRVYRTRDWAEIGRDQDYGASSYWVDFDGQERLVAGCYDGFIRLYDSDLRLIAKKKAPGGERPFSVEFSPDGSRIAVGFADSTAVNVLSGTDLSLLHAPDTSAIDNGNLGRVAWSRNGRTLFAAGHYNLQGDDRALVSWANAGRGPARIGPIAKDTIMALVPLADGRLVFGAGDPAWGLLDTRGKRVLGRNPAIADFRRRGHVLRLSHDGTLAEFDFKVLDTDGDWRVHRMRLDLTERRLELDPGSKTEQLQRRLRALGHAPGTIDGVLGPRTRSALKALQRERGLAVTGEADGPTRKALNLPRLVPPRIQAPGLRITDWYDQYEPKLNGKILDLKQFEESRRLDITQDGRRFLLGTEWYLRLYDRKGDLIRKTPAPATTWMVKLSGDGRWAVAAFGDGSLRWFDVENKGKERLALFIDGAAIAAVGRNKKAARIPWVLWTPESFFDSAGGGERLMGWHLNRGPDRAGELVDADQLGEIFRRPDLIAQALDPGYPALARTALAKIGDLKQLLAGTRAPRLERLGPAQVRQTERDFQARFRVEDRGGGVGRIEYRVDGVLIGQGRERGRFGLGLPNRREETRPFTLGPGKHRVEVRAYDQKDRLASPWVVWEVRVIGGSRRKPDLHGLAVGIGPYRDRSLSLEYGDDDAQAFAATIEETARGLFRNIEIRSLVNEQATLDGIRTAFMAMAEKAGPEDVFVLFLAGHGLVQDGRYHFIPWDLKYSNRKALESGSLHEERLRDLLAQVQARKSLVVIDSCYAGKALRGGTLLAALRGGEALETKAAIDRLMAKTGRAILASAAERQFALEGLDGHGVFTHVLLEGLRGRADLLGNRNHTIETGELADYLEEEVPRISRKVWGYEQHPMRDLQGQSFPIGQRRRPGP